MRQRAKWYERKKDWVREYNKKYNGQVHIKEYRRKKTAEYREQEWVRAKHNTREKQRRKDARYAFVSLVRSYGLEVIDFAKMLEAQGFRCAGCLETLSLDKKTHIDHCHKTQRVRGILCQHCNLVLGQAGDDPNTLRRLASYLDAAPVYVEGRLVPWEPQQS